ncbi:hypothetical protein LPJ66_000319 [Kickxella alabastrina]|uniref:Uncharacterized protein n=1 Tax=Kickxella alabastrina TaxID=61397 RepID=A0ACC1IWK7_9FUNG|nr:hypothetical protein LPJ66_000319 [Kickxella alabastrina]
MPTAENDLTELFIKSFKCTGDVPPALVGSSVTYLDGQAYVFGGRALHSGKLSNDMYMCDLRSFLWRRIDVADEPTIPAEDSDSAATLQCALPAPRFFHSVTAFKHYLVVFGGMGLDSDAEGSVGTSNSAPLGTAAGAAAHTAGIQDDRHQQSFQMRTTKTLLGDVAVFDTIDECWVALRALEDAGPTDAKPAAEVPTNIPPSPRYAHLATLFGSQLMVVGGQDLEEQYVEELNVFDLRVGRWIQRMPFPRAVGLYRSFIASVPATGTTLLYSNYSFASVKRALYSLSAPPECALKEMSEQLSGEPPGLRFPRGHLVDAQTVLMTGTLISTEGHSELSLWVLDSQALRWQSINCGSKFRAGSWNQSVVDPRTNTLVLFGDSRRDLTYDYQRRRLNYGEIRTVDLRALGYLRTRPPTLQQQQQPAIDALAFAALTNLQAPVISRPPFAESSSAETSIELGLQFLFFSQYGDAEVIAADGSRAAMVNSGILRARWPAQAQLWLVSETVQSPAQFSVNPAKSAAAASDENKRAGSRSTHRPESSLISGDYTLEGNGVLNGFTAGPKKFFIDGSRESICVLLFYLYTGRIDPQARLGLNSTASEQPGASTAADDLANASVLGELLVIARKYALHKLALQTVSLLRYKVTETTAPIIYEAALRGDHRGLQARCVIALKDHIGSFRVDRKSTLYMITNVSRASLIRFFPKLNLDDGSFDDTQTLTPAMVDKYYQAVGDSRQRSTSDAFIGSEFNPAAANGGGGSGGARNNSVPITAYSSQSPSGSPASTLRSNPARSPFSQTDHGLPRRPWESSAMASPVINSPSSSRFATQSPDMRAVNNTIVATAASDSRRLSNMSPLVNQSLPENTTLAYDHDSNSDTHSSHFSHASNRVSRYLGGGGGGDI